MSRDENPLSEFVRHMLQNVCFLTQNFLQRLLENGHDLNCRFSFLNRFFVWIRPFEVSDHKIKFDGMFKMPGRDFKKISFSAGKMADPQNPGFKSEKTLRCAISYQLYYLRSTFGVLSNDFDEIFKEFERLCRADKMY